MHYHSMHYHSVHYHSIVIGVSIEYMLKDLTTNTVKLWLIFLTSSTRFKKLTLFKADMNMSSYIIFYIHNPNICII